MKLRHYAEVAGLTLAAFAVGITWARNWPAVIGLAIGALMMALIMAWLHSAKRDEWKIRHHRETDRTRLESKNLGWKLCQEWHHRQRIGDGSDE